MIMHVVLTGCQWHQHRTTNPCDQRDQLIVLCRNYSSCSHPWKSFCSSQLPAAVHFAWWAARGTHSVLSWSVVLHSFILPCQGGGLNVLYMQELQDSCRIRCFISLSTCCQSSLSLQVLVTSFHLSETVSSRPYKWSTDRCRDLPEEADHRA